MEKFKIIYKILKILEKNIGNENFNVETISAKHLKIPYGQWEQILIMLCDAGYITGIISSRDLGDKFRHIMEPIVPAITIKGLEYLEENGFMAKAKEALKLVGDII